MYNIFNPIVNLATANLVALSRFALAPASPEQSKISELWQASMENQAHFINDYTQGLLGQMALARILMAGHMEKLSQGTEHVTRHLAHTTVRAVAIATHARREHRDRRVFPLTLPGERRAAVANDRRVRFPEIAHHAGA